MNEENKSNRGVVTGMFPDRDSTEHAYRSLEERGYTKDDINLIMSEDTRKKYFTGDAVETTEIGTKAAEGAGKGAAIGGTIGAIAGAIAAVGTSLLIPGLGILIAGPIAAGLAGAGAGGFTGTLVGALVGSGIPEARAKLYDEGVKNGKIVMSVRPRNEEDVKYIESRWNEHEVKDFN